MFHSNSTCSHRSHASTRDYDNDLVRLLVSRDTRLEFMTVTRNLWITLEMDWFVMKCDRSYHIFTTYDKSPLRNVSLVSVFFFFNFTKYILSWIAHPLIHALWIVSFHNHYLKDVYVLRFEFHSMWNIRMLS